MYRVAVFLLLVLLGWSSHAIAASSSDLSYSQAQIFSGALRYLRVDLGYEVTEKDPDAAYLLFRYVPHGKQEPTFGAVEIVQTKRAVRLTIKLPQLPSYHETVMRDGLLKKLRNDYGTEPARPDPPKADDEPEEEPDGDADDGEDPSKSKAD